MVAAVAAGLHFGVQEADICAALAAFEPVRQRGETVDTGRNTVIVDCYNANPSLVESTLRAFAAAGHGAPLAILGDMMELSGRIRPRVTAPPGMWPGSAASNAGRSVRTAEHAPGDRTFPTRRR